MVLVLMEEQESTDIGNVSTLSALLQATENQPPDIKQSSETEGDAAGEEKMLKSLPPMLEEGSLGLSGDWFENGPHICPRIQMFCSSATNIYFGWIHWIKWLLYKVSGNTRP